MRRRRVRWRGARLATAVLMAAVLVGCTTTAPVEPTPVEPTPVPPEPVTITWRYDASYPEIVAIWEDVARAFEGVHPHVTITMEGYDPDRSPSYLRADDLPDLFENHSPLEVVSLVHDGRLRDLGENLAPEVDALGARTDPWAVEGGTYGLPFTLHPWGVWYSTDLFARAGVPHEPTTYDELLVAAEAVREVGAVPFAVNGIYEPQVWWETLVVASCPADVLRAARRDLEFDHPCFGAAADRLDGLVAGGAFAEGAGSMHDGLGAEQSGTGLIAIGRAAMRLDGPWSSAMVDGRAQEVGLEAPDLGWFPFPAVEGVDGFDGGPRRSSHRVRPSAFRRTHRPRRWSSSASSSPRMCNGG